MLNAVDQRMRMSLPVNGTGREHPKGDSFLFQVLIITRKIIIGRKGRKPGL